MNIDQRSSITFDKENPPHPTTSHKKNVLSVEITQKKAVLGENTQLVSTEPAEECPSSPIGERLMQRKRRNQAKKKTTESLGFRLFEC